MITVDNLEKRYGKVHALRGLSLHVEKASIHGLIGPNGAGKSTTIKILSTLVRPDSGLVSLNGIPLKEGARIRDIIGVVPEFPGLEKTRSAREELEFHAKLYGLKEAGARIRILLRDLGLEDVADRPTAGYSTGMKKRTGMALALLHDPEIILLDEPMSGLDPAIRKQFRDIILKLKEKGKTILVSDHDLFTVEEICDRVTIIENGITVAEDSIKALNGLSGNACLELEMREPAAAGQLMEVLSALNYVTNISKRSKGLLVRVRKPESDFPSLIRTASANAELLGVRPVKQSLEEIFLNITEEMKNV
ncbi:MAG: ABC transporter ATP-binding protein [Methanosarcinaceae archaeon]|nr:ABC transporter ATP-binding protein [Methanosarcinaceae archaeon]MDD4497445.1 ABC transporter ATP-binding protein [Methanosarcinaceae archaeon]